MFNIDLPYKSATPMKYHSCTKVWFKKIFVIHFSTSLRVFKNYCILRPVLWMQ